MKFTSEEDQKVLQRLMSIPDFRHYVNMLWGDYKNAVRTALHAPAAEAEVARGTARALHKQLTDMKIDPDKPPREF